MHTHTTIPNLSLVQKRTAFADIFHIYIYTSRSVPAMMA